MCDCGIMTNRVYVYKEDENSLRFRNVKWSYSNGKYKLDIINKNLENPEYGAEKTELGLLSRLN